ncbi:MAG: hypothetical protein ACNS62_12065 [Candidatus Cyclobacteriaceae bacterium M3_2C_046]
MRPAIITCLIFLMGVNAILAQEIISKKSFENKNSLLIYEIPLVKKLNEQEFVILKEIKKGMYALQKMNHQLDVLWKTEVDFPTTAYAPQLLVNQENVYLITFYNDEKDQNSRLRLKLVDVKTGKMINQQQKTLVKFADHGPYPRLEFSPDRRKMVIFDYISATTRKPEFKIFDTQTLTEEKSVALEASVAGNYQKFLLENNGDVFFTVINPTLFRLDGYYMPFTNQEYQVLQNDLLFKRPLDDVGEVFIRQTGEKKFVLAATAKIKNDLIGLKLVGFDFENFEIYLDTVQNFNVQFTYYLYKDAKKVHSRVKRSSLGEPMSFKNFSLQNMYLNQQKDIILVYEKNLQASEYHYSFNNRNLPVTYNTGRKLQKSEDIMIVSFSREGKFKWDHVLQKYQVTRPHKYFIGYVSALDNNYLNILTWTKKGSDSFHVNRINTISGDLEMNGHPLLKGESYTYHKNYTTWLDTSNLLIMTQKKNKRSKRELQVIKIAGGDAVTELPQADTRP